MTKQSARDNPSYRRGLLQTHWEMPLDDGLKPFREFNGPRPQLFDLETDPSESKDVAQEHPELVKSLATTYDKWFQEVFGQWKKSRREILQHDQSYWKNRPATEKAE